MALDSRSWATKEATSYRFSYQSAREPEPGTAEIVGQLLQLERLLAPRETLKERLAFRPRSSPRNAFGTGHGTIHTGTVSVKGARRMNFAWPANTDMSPSGVLRSMAEDGVRDFRGPFNGGGVRLKKTLIWSAHGPTRAFGAGGQVAPLAAYKSVG